MGKIVSTDGRGIGNATINVVPTTLTEYYNLSGKLVKSANTQDEESKLLVLTSSKKEDKVDAAIAAYHVTTIPSDEVLSAMEQVYALTERTGNEHGFRVGKKGTVSVIVEGSPARINNEQWKPAISDITSKGDRVSYDVHSHPYEETKTTSKASDDDLLKIIGNRPNIVLGYYSMQNPKQPDQAGMPATFRLVKEIRFFDHSGNIGGEKAANFPIFVSAMRKINKM